MALLKSCFFFILETNKKVAEIAKDLRTKL